MRLLTGPAGSGKTSSILASIREALGSGDHAVRLLVPTATLAQHLRNRLARDGYVFPAALIQTLSAFVETWAGEVPQVSEAVLYLIVEEAARKVDRPEFTKVVRLPGFCASLARTIGEFSSAGCDSARLAGCLPPAPLSTAFLAVYEEVERELERRGLAMRARRLARAAERIRSEGTGEIRTIRLDGFHALPDPELSVIEALGRHADLTLTLSDLDLSDDVRERLRSLGFQEERATRIRGTPALALVRAAGIEREVEEIARRILEQAAAGRPFREIGIIVRTPDLYVPLLRSTLERFGIPARFYFDSNLEEHAAIRFLCGAIDAVLSGWDHSLTLAVLRLAPRFADSRAIDEFDFAVRKQIPNSGLGALKALLADEEGKPRSEGAERLLHKIDSLGALEEWRSFSMPPRDWAARFRTLRNLFRPPQYADRIAHEDALLWRSQAAVLDLFDEALDEAAQALDPRHPISLADYRRAVESVVRLKPLRLADGRRNVVHVLSAPEARQWVLPVVFVCGMVEKQFPCFHQQDPFFPDAARCRLNAAGVRVRTAAAFEHEEHTLFEAAISRASILATLSYPEFDSRGERNLPSIFLEGLPLAAQEPRPVRPRPRRLPTPPPPAEIRSPRLLEVLRAKTQSLSPTRLELFLQCPFQFFGGRTLRLITTPPLPEKRLDFLTQGSIVHEVLAAWYAAPQDIAILFQQSFEKHCDELGVPVAAYHTERLRNAMLDDLRAFVLDDRWPRGEYRSRMEEAFTFAIDPTLAINGKVDRIDIAPDGRAYVIDYKYSAAQRTKARLTDENLLQAPLYLLAAERVLGARPVGMFYVGIKGGVEYVGWSDSAVLGSSPFPENWLENTAARTLQVVSEIRGGRIEAHPADPEKCRYCDYRDVCRFEQGTEVAVAEGA